MLNPVLYSLLLSKFSSVRVCNQGQELVGRYLTDPISNRPVLEIDARGETYCINCPNCNDTRNRLYVNYKYGVTDQVTGNDNRYMVRCFNEECFKKDSNLYNQLYTTIFGLENRQTRNITLVKGTRPIVQSSSLEECESPGDLTYLIDLPSTHPAIKFLIQDRNYNLQDLHNHWNITYCEKAISRYKTATNRIIIPIIQKSKWVGWQARYIGDIDFKTTKIPKYFTLPTLPKRLILYNLDVAKNQNLGIVCEGPTSCWSLYPYGMAILGKQATLQQQRLLIEYFKNKTLVILLDGDARADANRLETLLKPYIPKLVRVDLPTDRDPGSYYSNKQELFDLINKTTKEKIGTCLDTYPAN